MLSKIDKNGEDTIFKFSKTATRKEKLSGGSAKRKKMTETACYSLLVKN
jgi:hypothetical protein